jgi:hypothetical protein
MGGKNQAFIRVTLFWKDFQFLITDSFSFWLIWSLKDLQN